MKLGVCYYPEQWPEAWWADDARRMREMGIEYVRIAEFAWSRIEPAPFRFEWEWLDRAVQVLAEHGLQIVMCTPTATPPKWLVDRHPDILAVDAHGVTRGFGSRRHYCFSSPVYRDQSARITRLMAECYGRHPAVVAWQTDNEYGCHDTVLSYSDAARTAFRKWLMQRYDTIEALNRAWGTVFWSQEYRSFFEIDPPVGTVTEANPSHRLDYRRFASDEVVAFNRAQVEIIRECSPGRPIGHNFMGFFTEFDHHAVAKDLDIATWDSYPLGFTQDRAGLTDDEKRRWLRTGHPDIPAFHHDLYRGMCNGRWWVMEQQPGPVNWAPWNPAPADGMVRLWTWQAFAHGAEVVSYFRWRQAPFAQEQMHTGLHRPDRSLDQGGVEAGQVGAELRALADAAKLDGLKVSAPVGLVFDYDAQWMAQIQPQGADFSYLHLAFRVYAVLRGMGFDVDIVSPAADLSDYRLLVLPAQFHVRDELATRLATCRAQVVFGPRCGSKTVNLHIAEPLPPGPLTALAGVRVTRVESLPPGVSEAVRIGATQAHVSRWREDLICDAATVEGAFADGKPAVTRCGRTRYVAGWFDEPGWFAVLAAAATDAGLAWERLSDGLRVSRIGDLTVACNFSDAAAQWAPPSQGRCLLGSDTLPPRGVSIWQA